MYGEKMYIFSELSIAHTDNDNAVMEAYGKMRRLDKMSAFSKIPLVNVAMPEAYRISKLHNSGKDDDHYPVGKGVIDWGEFFRAYNAYTPDREMILEYKGCTVADIVANARLIRTLVEGCK